MGGRSLCVTYRVSCSSLCPSLLTVFSSSASVGPDVEHKNVVVSVGEPADTNQF